MVYLRVFTFPHNILSWVSPEKTQVVVIVVLQKLQYQKARNLGLKISDDEVTLAVEGIAKRNELSVLRLREAIEKVI